MNTKATTTPTMMPYLEIGKLQEKEKHLTELIEDKTEDFISSSNIKKKSAKPLEGKRLPSFIQRIILILVTNVEYAQKHFEKYVVNYRALVSKYRDLTSISEDDSIADLERQKEKSKVKAELHKTYTDIESPYVKGSASKVNMLESDASLNIAKGEYQKTAHYLKNVNSADTELTAYNYPNELELNFPDSKMDISTVNEDGIPVISEKQLDVNVPSATVKEATTPPIIQTQKGAAQEYFVAEQQLEEAVTAFGVKYATKFKQTALKDVLKLKLSTTAKEVFKQSGYEQNILAHVSPTKLIWAMAVYALAVTSEALIFTSILSSVFNFSGFKAFVSGCSAFLISFVIGIALYGLVLDFFKNNNSLAVKLFNSAKLMATALVLSLLYTCATGLLFNNQREIENVQTQLSQQFLIDADEIDDDMSQEERNRILQEKGTKIGDLETQITQRRSGPMAALTAVTIAFSSGIFMLLSGIMFGVVLLFVSALKMKHKLKKLENRIADTEAQFYSTRHRLVELDHLGQHIIELIGSRQFIRQLISGGSPKEIIFKATTTTTKSTKRKG